jgi:hypothetical protein
VADTRLQRDRWVALALAGLLVAWCVLGMAYKRLRAEPYPALSMPGFAGNCGLTGSVYHDHQQRVEVELADGRVVEAPLVDTLLRCGMKRGEVPTVMAHLVELEGDSPETMRIRRVDPRLMEMALLGVSAEGPVPEGDAASVRVVLYHRLFDLSQKELSPAVVRLGDVVVTDDAPGDADPAGQ